MGGNERRWEEVGGGRRWEEVSVDVEEAREEDDRCASRLKP